MLSNFIIYIQYVRERYYKEGSHLEILNVLLAHYFERRGVDTYSIYKSLAIDMLVLYVFILIRCFTKICRNDIQHIKMGTFIVM